MASITLRRPDDWHVHFRDGAVLRTVVPITARRFGRAIVMPNLTPPVTTAAMAAAYRERVRAAIPAGVNFTPLMTCYLTDATDPADLIAGHRDGVFTAAKLYPANATTNSSHGVTDVARIFSVLAAMEKAGMPLLVHGEVNDQTVDIFDREAVFIERVLDPTRKRFPGLKVVMEHVTTKEAVDYVRAGGPLIGATITPQHLMINRNAIFRGGIRPHYYCLPIAKREQHRLAVRAAATSGERSFFLGTDTAPHLRHLKEAECGCAGLFNAPAALECYATVFAQENALDKLEAFASLNGPAFYGLPPNEERVTLVDTPPAAPVEVAVPGEGSLRAFGSDEALGWSVAEAAAA